jgi:hypothetical protein
MGIKTKIDYNTDLLNDLKNLIENLPNRDEVSTDLFPTTAGQSNLLAGKTAYIVDDNGKPTMVSGTMPNLDGSLNVKVGVDGTGVTVKTGYVTKVTGSFSEEVNNEITTQADLIAQIKQKLIEKGAHL